MAEHSTVGRRRHEHRGSMHDSVIRNLSEFRFWVTTCLWGRYRFTFISASSRLRRISEHISCLCDYVGSCTARRSKLFGEILKVAYTFIDVE